MKEFLQYIFSQVKNNSLSKKEAMDLIQKYQAENNTQVLPVGFPGLQENTGFQIGLNRMAENTGGVTEPFFNKEAGRTSEEAFELMTFEEVWDMDDIEEVSRSDIKTVVCFLSKEENMKEFAEKLNSLSPDARIVFISWGTLYEKLTAERYTVSKDNTETYIKAFDSIREDSGQVDAILYMWPVEDKECIYDNLPIVRILQALAGAKLKVGSILLAAQFENGLERCYLESWIGFERSLGLVMPNTRVAGIFKEVGHKSRIHIGEWVQTFCNELKASKLQGVTYEGGKRHVCRIRPTAATEEGSLLKNRGTYLITGGCGGIGLVLARHLAKSRSANLVLTGRSSLDDKKSAEIEVLEKLGGKVLYVQADICDKSGMEEGIKKARKLFGNIDGVIHAAGIAGDTSIFVNDCQAFNNVLEPKIQGTVLLDELLKSHSPDFICYFSSSSAILGDFGFCNYAIGNRFQMAYARYRNHMLQKGMVKGKAVAINWPLWKDGGMGFNSDENTKMYLKSSGQRFLEAPEGVEIFEKVLVQKNTQYLILVGQPGRVRRFLGISGDTPLSSPLLKEQRVAVTPGKGRRKEMRGLNIEQCLEWDLKEEISKLLKIPREKLDKEENLADFGFDSIILAEFADVLTAHYGIEITPALFFGHSTIEKLMQYFLTQHKEAVNEFYREEVLEQRQPVKNPQAKPVETINLPHIKPFVKPSSSDNTTEPIAIIGMSGRFPDARNVDEMWEIIEEGREAVREIPVERFDWRQYREVFNSHAQWRCGLIPGVGEFDPLFFEISPVEAETMDPRQRLLLQEAWNALEDAGYGAASIRKSKIGMFVGVEDGNYGILTGGKGGITSNHSAILAARLSYFLNLDGPNMAINTACSSGLVAAHQACQSLRSGECDTAIAAGVNLLLVPGAYIGMAQAGMLSPDGRCYTFDKRANGMVPGEAVAVLVLKRLSRAEADGDRIYAIIKGSGINYDGKTNGITAPSGVSQAGLLKSVYDKYGINPENMDYIVTHGTGTKLGDPIEVNALYDAFKEYTQKQSYCALTSTKTNFGHSLAASGLVSLISLVQALRHETIPASLNCEEENNFINWKESPFYVNKSNKPWKDEGARVRTGAVSAFGMSGTNAHMVLQSYAQRAGSVGEQAPYYIVALSAKTGEALGRKINDMITLLESHASSTIPLSQVSYTLLEGRQHFEYRFAAVIQDREDAIYVLKQAGSREKLTNLFKGNVSRNFIGQEAIKQYIQDLLEQGSSIKEDRNKYRETLYALADLYCTGYEIDWSRLYKDARPLIARLPGYPFARENYWVSESYENYAVSAYSSLSSLNFIHPLLHENTSDLSEQRFSSTFTGNEFFLRDHIIKGHKVLPGVAYLEMAREAVVHSAGLEQAGVRLKNVVWSHPVVVDEQPFKVNIGLIPENNGEIAFEIYSQAEGDNGQVVVHSQGRAVPAEDGEAPNLDITAIKSQCNQSTLTSAGCYETFKAWGIDYGPAHRGINQVYIGQAQALAKLSLDASVRDNSESYILHPGMMDSALQASIGLMANYGAGDQPDNMAFQKPLIPFALTELVTYSRCDAEMWAYVRFGSKEGEKIIKIDIDLCDMKGKVCVSIKGYSSRTLESEIGAEETAGIHTQKQEPASDTGVNRPVYSTSVHKAEDMAFEDNENILKQKLKESLIQTVSQLLDVKKGDIDYEAGWEDYGFEQFKLAKLVDILNEEYKISLNISVCAECLNLRDFAEYLLKAYRDVLVNLYLGTEAKLVSYAGKNEEVPVFPDALLREKALNYLKNQVSAVIKLPADRIEAEAPMEKYGINSIMSMQLVNQLEKTFGSLPKTLFFEYQNISELTGYFMEEYRERLTKITGAGEKSKTVKEGQREATASEQNLKLAVGSPRRSRFAFQSGDYGKGKRQGALDIAIIGLAGRYPMANNVEEYWENLKSGRDCITEIPKERWDHSLYFDEDKNKPGKTYAKWGGFIDGVDKFDPLFFNISPREAEGIDPQERLFLECVYSAVEDAGYTKESLGAYQGFGLGGSVGVFVGVMYEEYQLFGAQSTIIGKPYAVPGNPSSIANRVSYFFNLHGPSMAVDTMCSSSLTSIHLACQSLLQGGCKLAIAGGVNISIHPNKYLQLAQGKFASSKGKCESFGMGGDGYVPGEGVGAIILKPLSEAIADNDHIYGVIKASALNHGGKTNGYTVPNPNAQAEIIGCAIKEAGINPRTISYIEAHGTGTSLGDPIEIAGLNKVFNEYTKDKQFCAIGSAKSNIGHCESAAGIAGITKVLMQMKYRKLAPSIHSKTLNPYIDFTNSPFVVQQKLEEWKRPVVEIDGYVKEYPRIAGISSFGAGGSNAHIVIEEYMPGDETQSRSGGDTGRPTIILLSAKDEEGLRERVRQLLAVIKNRYNNNHLRDIAYTLQVGREAMEERLALLADTIEEVEEKLSAYQEGKEGIDKVYRGNIKRNKEALDMLTGDEDLANTVDTWIIKGKYSKLLEFWIKGLNPDWDRLYDDAKPTRISLPAYPFAGERYWLPPIEPQFLTVQAEIHPLLHRNTSDIFEQRFTSSFTGQEFYLTDHVVNGRKVLPGVAYLEMARAAVEEAAGALLTENTGIQLKNVAWVKPIAVGDTPVNVHTAIIPQSNDEFAFEIYSKTENEDYIIHCQGSAVISDADTMGIIDIKTILESCGKGLITSEQCYSAFKEAGLNYGPAHQGIEQLYVGENRVLAKLSLTSAVPGAPDRFVLHPAIMDSALQASIGLMWESADNKLSLPFAMQELKISGNTAADMWAYVRRSDGSKAEDKVQKLDIDLCDEGGSVCVQIKGYSSRVLDGEIRTAETEKEAAPMMVGWSWEERPATERAVEAGYTERLVLLCEQNDSLKQYIEANISNVRCISIEHKQFDIDKRFKTCASKLFVEVQRLFKKKHKGKVLIQVVVPVKHNGELYMGLSGLLKTAQLENNKLIGQFIIVESWDRQETIVKILEEESRSQPNEQIRYISGKRHTLRWSELSIEGHVQGTPWKNKGVYLVTGGIGGLGIIFAKEIARTVKGATIVLTGRSALSSEKEALIKDIEDSGSRVVYIQADVADKEAVNSLIRSIKSDFGSLNGIIHSAGVIRDNFIIKKTEDEFVQVIEPKVSGLVNLDEASRDMELDVFIMFSSTSGCFGNTGQADYAAGNGFMDSYAQYRNGLRASGKCKGLTISINWPLWKNGGMHIDAETEKMMNLSGIKAMETMDGINALYRGLESGRSQVAVLQGDKTKIRQLLFPEQGVAHADPRNGFGEQEKNSDSSRMKASLKFEKETNVVSKDLLEEKALNYFKSQVSSVIKLAADRIEADDPMEKYGIDSVMSMQLVSQLEKAFGSLPKTLFFEYQNVRELTGYFIETYKEQLIKILGIGKTQEAIQEPRETKIQKEPLKLIAGRRRPIRFAALRDETKTEKKSGALDVAIIGVSGRYPKSRNLTEYWENLKNGVDCITEIPKERWDHNLFFDEDKGKPGKTYSKWGGFIDGVDRFDPLFFNISPKEAEMMDPQERLFLQCAYSAMEDAGYTREILGFSDGFGLNGNVGVFVGVMYEEYQLYGAQSAALGVPFALPGNPSSIANRVSYFCNFHGPSMAVDTMCSSSLTAIHLACQSLQQGSCKAAIAGGVNVSVHPNKYLLLAQGRFASSKGRCEAFGMGGDGYVAGEGVGAVILKPLSKAVEDGDHIYGVIKASALNHGGKTNGYTVPNPNAQADVIGRALKEVGINPRTISYIEAHGTGTSLGDPIEIVGLNKVFTGYTDDKQFCAIGSAKSNIGHCESAAGIAGVTKVLLQMKHGKLVPSLHSKTLNPYIDFKNSPFKVQQELAEWKRPVVSIDGVEKEYPRIAGISSFGAGGSNAHVVIEEYIPQADRKNETAIGNTAIVVLSAKDEDRLKERVRQLLTAIKEGLLTGISLTDIAYTLQVGREAMDERLALLTGSFEELEEKLSSYLEGKTGIEDLYHSQVKRNNSELTIWTEDEDLQTAIDVWITKGKYSKILDLWAKGLNLDWNRLYRGEKPLRTSLPSYPFADDRYWFTGDGKGFINNLQGPAAVAAIHPLLHRNTSDFSMQKYSSYFTGCEYFLAEYVIDGQKVLPAFVLIEMAREAVKQATGVLREENVGIRFKDIVFPDTVNVGDRGLGINIGLIPEENGDIGFSIFGEPEEPSGEHKVYCQGRAMMGIELEGAVDIGAIQSQCDEKILSSAQCYEIFKARRIDYGSAYRCIKKEYTGNGKVLAALSLPEGLKDTLDRLYIHPCMADAALQALVGLTSELGDLVPGLPAAIEEVEVFDRCSSEMWVLIRTYDKTKGMEGVQKFHLDLYDDQGRICLRIKGPQWALPMGGGQTIGSTALDFKNHSDVQFDGNYMMVPVWDVARLDKMTVLPSCGDRVLIVGGTEENRKDVGRIYPRAYLLEKSCECTVDELVGNLASLEPIDHVIWIAPDNTDCSMDADSLIAEQNKGVLQTFRFIKAALRLGYGKRELSWTIITVKAQPIGENDLINPAHASIHGLAGSLAKEYRNWKIRLVDLDTNYNWPVDEIFRIPEDRRGRAWVYRHNNWYRQQLIRLESSKTDREVYKTGGVYVVIGGAGGIGEVWSEHMVRSHRANIVWIGRRQKDAAIEAKIKRLTALGCEPYYIAADAADKKALQEAYKKIKKIYPEINGIVHSAMVFYEQPLESMEEEGFRAALSAKVDVSVNMAQVFKEEKLDFVLFFSSIVSLIKNPGQSGYASGCAFKDAFAHLLSSQWSCPVKIMNWGYWRNAVVDDYEAYKLLIQTYLEIGIGLIEPPEAMEALDVLMSGSIDQIAFMKTSKPLPVEGLNQEETIKVYSQKVTSNIKKIQDRILKHRVLPEEVKEKKHSANGKKQSVKKQDGN